MRRRPLCRGDSSEKWTQTSDGGHFPYRYDQINDGMLAADAGTFFFTAFKPPDESLWLVGTNVTTGAVNFEFNLGEKIWIDIVYSPA